MVSIHAPVKGATDCDHDQPWSKPVSIHAPVKGATRESKVNMVNGVVSIHAPVKGATGARRFNHDGNLVSIHAPVKGATPVPHATVGFHWCFNPRTREGCDFHLSIASCGRMTFQSTHP